MQCVVELYEMKKKKKQSGAHKTLILQQQKHQINTYSCSSQLPDMGYSLTSVTLIRADCVQNRTNVLSCMKLSALSFNSKVLYLRLNKKGHYLINRS